MKNGKCLAVVLVLLLVAACGNGRTSRRNVHYHYYQVTKITDGDTIRINDGSPKGLRIRLIGIDAPETRKVREKSMCYGREAKAYLTNLLRGKEVRYELDKDPKDQYGRTLAYVYLRDGTFVNAEMVRNGYAIAVVFRPNVKYEKHLRQLQDEAKAERRGLWQNCPQ